MANHNIVIVYTYGQTIAEWASGQSGTISAQQNDTLTFIFQPADSVAVDGTVTSAVLMIGPATAGSSPSPFIEGATVNIRPNQAIVLDTDGVYTFAVSFMATIETGTGLYMTTVPELEVGSREPTPH
jgi:hypothetical protein